MNESNRTQEGTVQTTLTETEDWTHISEIERKKAVDALALDDVQVIEVMDWGMAERKNDDTGEVEQGHDFLVHSDNAIVAVGIGDINQAIEDVRKELLDKGYSNIVVNRIPMKPGLRFRDKDLNAWVPEARE